MPLASNNNDDYNRRNNDGIYQRIDVLESKICHETETLKNNQGIINDRINILAYQVGLIMTGLKLVLSLVATALVIAILRMILIS